MKDCSERQMEIAKGVTHDGDIATRRFALSRQGAVDLIKGCIACVVQDISLMIPVGFCITLLLTP